MASIDLPLQGKTAVITGGSKGIGASTAVLLAKKGANVVINYGRDTASADALINDLGDKDRSLAIQADAGSIAGVDKIVSETVAKFGKIDILILNAGVLPMKDIEATTEADFDKTFNLNVKGPYFLAQKAVPHIPAGGKIIFLSTGVCSFSGVAPNYLLYASTKGAIDQMTRVLAKGLAPKGINVNAIAPGPTGTELFLEGKSEQLLKAMASQIPKGRVGQPDEIADAIGFLCSEESRWVVGQILRVNGGMML